MLTIYEKEANFDQIDESFSKIKKLICASVGEALNEVEGELFRKLQQLGLQLLSCYVDVCGTGYEADHPLESEDGVKMRYKGLQEVSYLSIFGQLCINRGAYAHPNGTYIYPLDERLNLPEHKYSYLGMVQKGGKKGNNLKELGKRLPPSHRGHFFNLKISSNIKKKLSRFFKRDKT